MLSSGYKNEPSALLSNARATVVSLIQRPNSVTTSNAFDECAILDRLIDVSNDVDRFESGESRKFLDIAQVITASTCIYSRRVDALYKLINTFRSSSQNENEHVSDDEEHEQTVQTADQSFDVEKSESAVVADGEQKTKPISEKKKKAPATNPNRRSFVCTDPAKITLNPSKVVFVERTSSHEHKLFQKHVPFGNRPFWINDTRPIIFNLLFGKQSEDNEDKEEEEQDQQPERLVDALHQMPPPLPMPSFDDDIPLPMSPYDDNEVPWADESIVDDQQLAEKKKQVRIRSKKTTGGIDIEIFRRGLTDEQQALFRFNKRKSTTSNVKIEQTRFFVKPFTRQHFDALIKDCDHLTLPCFIYPTISNHYLTIRERYSPTIRPTATRIARSPPVPLCDVLDDNALVPLPPSPSPLSFTMENHNDDDQEDGDTRLQFDMEQLLDAACHSDEEQEQNKIFLALRSSILSYLNEHPSTRHDVDDLLDSLNHNYALPLVFSQLLHICASTQRYYLRSTSIERDKLFIEKLI